MKTKNEHAAALGSIKSEKKAAAARENGKKGGRPEIEMKGQEKWTSGNELRWVIGTDENGPAKVVNSIGNVVFRGSYAEAVRWLERRACRPARVR